MNFNQTKQIAVIGDIILDEFIFGVVERINPEAPVPILKVKEREFRLGGAANVANNIVSLGGECILIGKIGKDGLIQNILDEKKIKYSLITDKDIQSTKKSRFIAGNQQLFRVDEEELSVLNPSELKIIRDAIGYSEVIIIADYGKGLITKELMNELRSLGKTILVDPKVLHPDLFKDVFLLKPNLKETENTAGYRINNEEELERAAEKLKRDYNSNILITRGKDGMSLFELDKKSLHIPTTAREVYDVTGAGDTVIATVGLALASNKNLEESIILANHAAGIVVGRVGTSTLTNKELFASIDKEITKIKSQQEIAEIASDLRKKGKKIVFTNGCFDILHIEHTRLFQKARGLGDILILGLNTDSSIIRMKGQGRVVVNEKERAEILSALECVDYLVFFDEGTPLNLLSNIKPDILVIQGDYSREQVVGEDIVKRYGGQVEYVNLSDK